MTRAEIESVLAHVAYRGWELHVYEDLIGRLFLQVRFEAPDSETGQPEKQHGRKWVLSEHMTRSELVQTALKAVLTAVEHEAREQFRYRGQPIFGPHFDVEALWEIADRQDRRVPV